VLVRGLQSKGHQVGLVARGGSTCPADAFYPWPGQRSQSRTDTLSNSMTLWKAKRDFRPDLIHSFSRIAYLLPHLRGPVPLVMSFQRDPTPRTVGLAARLAAPGMLTFTGCSEYIARIGRPSGGEWLGIHNFADTENLHFSSNVPADAPLVFLSRVEQIKGAHWAIEIARRTGSRLIIAGNHSDSGPEGDYWRTRIVPEIGRDGVEYVGPVDDMQKDKLLGGARAMVVPIRWNEPFGIVFAESLACGTPVISCPTGALPEIVRQGVDGFLVQSIEEGCEAVGKLAMIDRAACRQRAVEHFSADAVLARYIELYTRLVARKAA
jgi:glycosyltransferase involved in cell wall biosynthesis